MCAAPATPSSTPSSAQTEAERKAADCLRAALKTALREQPHLEPMLAEIRLTLLMAGEDMPRTALVEMPAELLLNVKLVYSSAIAGLKKQFPEYMVLLRRSGEIVPRKGSAPSRARETILNDLVFPAAVVGRATAVRSKEDLLQEVYIDGRQQCWSSVEMRALEAVLKQVFAEEFSLALFTPSD